MVQIKKSRKVIKPLAKGQITIPREYREALKIDSETLLSITIVGDHLEIRPLRQNQNELRRYTDEEVARFVEEDKIDDRTAEKIHKMIRQAEL